jgi:hypothetical protein
VQPVIAHELRLVCIPIDRSVSVSFSAEFHFTAPFFKKQRNHEKRYRNVCCIKLCSCMSHNSSAGSPAVLFVEGKLSAQGFEGCETSVLPAVLCGSSTVVHLPGMPVSEVCYFRHSAWFDEIDPGFKFNTEILGIRCLGTAVH